MSRARRPAAGGADEAFVQRALALAARAEGRTAPNPIVGCVIVGPDGRVRAEGFHARAGQPHAEAVALAALGGDARGCTVYVTLEPCAHTGRTPPCADALIRAGVARVVYGAADPIAGHGGGARRLARAGVAVTGGVLAAACESANAGFFTHARLGRPHVLLKAAVSLDGRVAPGRGSSRWITGAAARADGHRQRDRRDVIMVGVGTVLADDPRLTCRGVEGGRDPVRVVVDSALRTPPRAAVVRAVAASVAPTIIACTRGAPARRRAALERAGAEVLVLPPRGGRVSLRALLRRLGDRGARTVLVEGGATLHGALLAEDLADAVRLYQAPIVLGAGPAWADMPAAPSLRRAPRLSALQVEGRLGDDLVLVAARR